MHILLPPQIEYILNTFSSNNFDAYIVGGCVRDLLMNKTPTDWDICSSALPEQTIKLFKNHKILKNGLKHGTVTVLFKDKSKYEITTFRSDGIYTDNRHPDQVSYVTDIKTDLSRRDFTINAFAYNQEKGLLDFFDGITDLKNKVIRCIGNPDTRFQEDGLRILRALRFSSVLNFNIEIETSNSILKNWRLLDNISIERITTEFNKLLLGVNVNNVVNKYFFLDNINFDSIFIENNENATLLIRLSYFFINMKKNSLNLKLDNKSNNVISELIKYHDLNIIPDKIYIKQCLNKMGIERFQQLLILKHCVSPEIKNLLNSIIENKECFNLKQLAINGTDIKQIGIKESKKIGEHLNNILNLVINEKIINNKGDIMSEIINMEYQNLLDIAKTASENAYSPYSNFKVGAAIKCKNGMIYTGCNIENASFSATICAERVAAAKAISENNVDFLAIAVYVQDEKLFPPCGICRQFLAEFSDDLVVIYANKNETVFTNINLLLPSKFAL
ncbi:MAG: cytidine deaminase [Candidatus Cloacimonetes bacterium]|nr:cytidine deaminase [Candidatus Cloacimonadota bacterium]